MNVPSRLTTPLGPLHAKRGWQTDLAWAADAFATLRARDIALAALVLMWPWIGLFGHEPWKADEAYSFGLVYSFLEGRDLLAPLLAGSYFMEKPPLVYWMATAFARALGGIMPLPDAARLVAPLFMYVTLGFLAATGGVLFGRERAWSAVILFIGAVGLFDKVHMLVADVGLIAGLSIGLFGLVVTHRHPAWAGLALGLGTVLAFMSKGLIGPALLGVTTLVLLVCGRYRSHAAMGSLLLAVAIAVPLMSVWPLVVYATSPPLFWDWLWLNNFGRFLGFARLGPRHGVSFYPVTLLWFSFPLWPLAIAGVTRRGTGDAPVQPLLVPLVFMAVTAAVLIASADSRSMYAVPLLLPMSILAAVGLDRISATLGAELQQWTQVLIWVLVGLLWLSWVGAMVDAPYWLENALGRWAPGFSMPFSPWLVVAALLGTAAWIVATVARPLGANGAAESWAAGTTIAWMLVLTLWMPLLDHVKSYRSVVFSLRDAIPADAGCVASVRLGEPQRAMLHYYIGLLTESAEVEQDQTRCDLLLLQTRDAKAPPAVSLSGWELIWRGARPGDDKEAFYLYRRDRAPGS